ncbi:hypothetical protein EVAR_37778_1 [Eumeta japonica]|uniref:Uncharacterized protein n=1 Tax=Eumeta variegata TaxID=151549 RepID=A0A4C1WNG1_EUMVA|nr:hypothetical protein EVAR_37778_1 [Eumeta japonica]
MCLLLAVPAKHAGGTLTTTSVGAAVTSSGTGGFNVPSDSRSDVDGGRGRRAGPDRFSAVRRSAGHLAGPRLHGALVQEERRKADIQNRQSRDGIDLHVPRT